MKKDAHEYLISKGCLSIKQIFSAFEVEKMLIEFAEQQILLLNTDGRYYTNIEIEQFKTECYNDGLEDAEMDIHI